MNKKPYAYLDGIPDKSSDLYNDAGYLNEAEVQAEIGNYLDIDDATAGQVLTMGESGFPEWDDVASGGGGVDYSETEVDTGLKWIDGKKVYQKTYSVTGLWNASPARTIGTLTGFETIIDIRGVVKNTAANYFLPIQYYEGDYVQGGVHVTTTGNIQIYTPSDVRHVIVTVYYTKIS